MKLRLTEKSVEALKPEAKPKEYRDSEVRGFYVRVESSGHKSFFYEHHFGNRLRKKVKIGECSVIKVSDARARALILKVELSLSGEDGIQRRNKKIVLRDFITNHYAPHAIASTRSGKEVVACLLRAFPHLLNEYLSDITPYKIDQWKAQYGSSRKPASVNRALSDLKTSLNKAVQWKFLKVNPIAQVKLLKLDASKDVRFLNVEEETKFYQALLERDLRIKQSRDTGNAWREDRNYELMPSLQNCFADHFTPMVLVSMNTGMRQGEVFNLRVRNVDFLRKEIVIEGARAKSLQTRVIPMNQTVFNALKIWINQRTISSLDEFVFQSNKTGGRFCDVKKAWKKLLEDAKIKSFRWHDQRHHFASTLAMKGESLQVIRDLLGHSDIKCTLIYAKLDRRTLASAVQRLDGPVDMSELFSKTPFTKIISQT